ncbi:hypothetical protein LOZ12_003875 [Ophidiomyces ophidiicola]|nr:hypothetical protein LOZ62_004074 [Ophidiomyces ophidiicola]KAI1948637.1 hypothetical protein LOZ59_006317 [Ophidiomyces ophidiicola]KAI1969588.1 hypothetical protein LOZ56_004292 [Ophidiomyces ophidiicola]KAI2000152.1 hypothetical protein LOZ50_006179 [Ophidiomyces ophidiicola]KAI2022031.1 hypothetical protein LOZ45_004541 [Ophidiomyces ophidiicola]
MGPATSLFKTLLIPALISLALYLVLFYAVVPFIRNYRQRYAQYLPLHTLTIHTASLRERASDALMHFMLPSAWRSTQFAERQDDSGSLFDEEEGEGLVGFEMDPTRRAALERRRDDPLGTEGRLSRELEEGFMDDSEDDSGMAIIDGIEVLIMLSNLNFPLQEQGLPISTAYEDDVVAWASNSTRISKAVIAPPGQTFAINIRLRPEFDVSVGDGLHVTLKIDQGAIVNHFYSFKFTEMEVDREGLFSKVIDNAIIGAPGGFEKVLFSFVDLPPYLLLLPCGHEAPEHEYPQGKISVTIIRVTHVLQPPQQAAVPSPEVQSLFTVSQRDAMKPIRLGVAYLPLVLEQTLPAKLGNERVRHFVLWYTVTTKLFQG